ncbi:MAG: hypothetical protein WBG30_07840 [Psychrilyobacter sp.]|uniref:hypothetical protein n=1 Tax=Psychrilyobacter sp. TaxID=2586924 RepID=UPI003C751F24
MVEKAYDEIYQTMKELKGKGLKMTLKKNIEGVLFTNIRNVDSLLNQEEKKECICHTQYQIDILVKEIILKNGNREKIRLRNFFSESHKKLWGRYQIY